MQMQVVEQARGRKCKVLLVQAGPLPGQGEKASNFKLIPAPSEKRAFNAAPRQNSSKGEWLVQLNPC